MVASGATMAWRRWKGGPSVEELECEPCATPFVGSRLLGGLRSEPTARPRRIPLRKVSVYSRTWTKSESSNKALWGLYGSPPGSSPSGFYTWLSGRASWRFCCGRTIWAWRSPGSHGTALASWAFPFSCAAGASRSRQVRSGTSLCDVCECSLARE